MWQTSYTIAISIILCVVQNSDSKADCRVNQLVSTSITSLRNCHGRSDKSFHTHRTKRKLSKGFDEVLAQRITGNQVDQCPCVVKPGSDKCISYDSRYQAASIIEAILACPDLTLDPEKLIPYSGEPYDIATFECKTLECQTCAAILLRRLKDIGLISEEERLPIPVPLVLDPRNCHKLRIAKLMQAGKPDINPPPASPEIQILIANGLKQIGITSTGYGPLSNGNDKFKDISTANFPQQISATQRIYSRTNRFPHQSRNQFPHQSRFKNGRQWFEQRNPQNKLIPRAKSAMHQRPYSSYVGPHHQQFSPVQTQIGNRRMKMFHRITPVSLPVPPQRQYRREKRQLGDEILGSRFKLTCVKRGDSDSENNLSLCGHCWTWRQLPEEYFPRFVNELLCEENSYCLSGWGTCKQRYRNLDILRKVGNDWKSTVISIGSCCECSVKAGNDIHALVIGEAK